MFKKNKMNNYIMKTTKDNSFWKPVKISSIKIKAQNPLFSFPKASNNIGLKPINFINHKVSNLKTKSSNNIGLKSVNFINPKVSNSKFSNNIGLKSVNFINPNIKLKYKNNNSKPKTFFGTFGLKPAAVFKNIQSNLPKKQMNWIDAKTKYPKLNPFKDADRDGVINMLDCKPFDKDMQDETSKKYFDDIDKKKIQRKKDIDIAQRVATHISYIGTGAINDIERKKIINEKKDPETDRLFQYEKNKAKEYEKNKENQKQEAAKKNDIPTGIENIISIRDSTKDNNMMLLQLQQEKQLQELFENSEAYNKAAEKEFAAGPEKPLEPEPEFVAQPQEIELIYEKKSTPQKETELIYIEPEPKEVEKKVEKKIPQINTELELKKEEGRLKRSQDRLQITALKEKKSRDKQITKSQIDMTKRINADKNRNLRRDIALINSGKHRFKKDKKITTNFTEDLEKAKKRTETLRNIGVNKSGKSTIVNTIPENKIKKYDKPYGERKMEEITKRLKEEGNWEEEPKKKKGMIFDMVAKTEMIDTPKSSIKKFKKFIIDPIKSPIKKFITDPIKKLQYNKEEYVNVDKSILTNKDVSLPTLKTEKYITQQEKETGERIKKAKIEKSPYEYPIYKGEEYPYAKRLKKEKSNSEEFAENVVKELEQVDMNKIKENNNKIPYKITNKENIKKIIEKNIEKRKSQPKTESTKELYVSDVVDRLNEKQIKAEKKYEMDKAYEQNSKEEARFKKEEKILEDTKKEKEIKEDEEDKQYFEKEAKSKEKDTEYELSSQKLIDESQDDDEYELPSKKLIDDAED